VGTIFNLSEEMLAVVLHREIEAGLEEARRGKFTSDEEVKETFAKWGAHIETEIY